MDARTRTTAMVASLASLPLLLSTPAHAAMDQISGVAVLADAGECTDDVGPAFQDYTLSMAGDLEGCWYTRIDTAEDRPSGVYLETGQEIFIGTIGGVAGSFTTTYKFEAKFAPDGSEIHGRCQHPIIAGSGTGVFAGATGRLNFKDIVETGEFVYKGHVDLA